MATRAAKWETKPLAGFVNVPTELVFNNGLKPADLRVYCIVRLYIRAKRDMVSHATIAGDCRRSPNAVRLSLNRLREAGYVDWDKTTDKEGRQGVNKYRLLT